MVKLMYKVLYCSYQLLRLAEADILSIERCVHVFKGSRHSRPLLEAFQPPHLMNGGTMTKQLRILTISLTCAVIVGRIWCGILEYFGSITQANGLSPQENRGSKQKRGNIISLALENPIPKVFK